MDLHFYCTFLVYWPLSALQHFMSGHIHPFTHTFTQWRQRLPRKVPTAHQEQFGVQCRAQWHFDMSGIRTRLISDPFYSHPRNYPSNFSHRMWVLSDRSMQGNMSKVNISTGYTAMLPAMNIQDCQRWIPTYSGDLLTFHLPPPALFWYLEKK